MKKIKMNKNYMRHPNRLVNKHTQDIENKSLYTKIRTVKSTVDQTNKVFLQKLEERKRRELKTFCRGSIHKPMGTAIYTPYTLDGQEMPTRPCSEYMAKKPSRGDPLGRAVTAQQNDVDKLTGLVSPKSKPTIPLPPNTASSHRKKGSVDKASEMVRLNKMLKEKEQQMELLRKELKNWYITESPAREQVETKKVPPKEPLREIETKASSSQSGHREELKEEPAIEINSPTVKDIAHKMYADVPGLESDSDENPHNETEDVCNYGVSPMITGKFLGS